MTTKRKKPNRSTPGPGRQTDPPMLQSLADALELLLSPKAYVLADEETERLIAQLAVALLWAKQGEDQVKYVGIVKTALRYFWHSTKASQRAGRDEGKKRREGHEKE